MSFITASWHAISTLMCLWSCPWTVDIWEERLGLFACLNSIPKWSSAMWCHIHIKYEKFVPFNKCLTPYRPLQSTTQDKCLPTVTKLCQSQWCSNGITQISMACCPNISHSNEWFIVQTNTQTILTNVSDVWIFTFVLDDELAPSSTTASFGLLLELPYWDSSHLLCSSRVFACCCSETVLMWLS